MTTTDQSIKQQLAATEVNALNPYKLKPLVEFQAKKEVTIQQMSGKSSIPSSITLKDGQRIIARIDSELPNGKFKMLEITLLNGNIAQISTEHFHQVQFNQFSNRYKLLAQFH